MMTQDEIDELNKYDLPPATMEKLRGYVEAEPKVNEPSSVSFGDGYDDIKYTDKIKADEIEDKDLQHSKELLKEVMEEKEFALDNALDSYDPQFPGYVPSEEAFEFFNIMRLIEGQDFDFNTPVAHYFMVDLLLNNITDKYLFPYSREICDTIEINHLRIAYMCSRGVAKSSVVISFFGVYSAIKGELPNDIGKVWFYLVLAASSRGGARVNALAVRAMCEDSEFLKGYFEEMRFTESESEFIRKGTSAKKHRSFLIRYQGVGTGVRGIRYGERRICTIINDDIILNEAAAYSKTISENLESVMHSDSIAALKGGGKGRIINCFTPFSYTDVNTQLVLNGAYTPCVIPLARNIDTEDPALSYLDIESTWESMHPRRSIMDLIKEAKKTKKLNKFMQERMLRLTSDTDRLIPDDCFQWIDMRDVERNIGNYNIYITTDYTTASGEKKDFSGRATWAVNNNKDWFLLDLSLRKMTIPEQYRDTLSAADKYKRQGKFVHIGVEIDGNQQAHVYGLQTMMREQGVFYTFARQKDAPDTRVGILSRGGAGGGKHERFRIASQRMIQKKVFLPLHLKDAPDMKEMVQQIKGATHIAFSRADDGPDLITQLDMIEVQYPSEVAVQSSHTYGNEVGAHIYQQEDDYSAYDSY